ncbi:MAG: DUF1330 domain-containing protein [Alphaproteobacteria bacterium]|nr:MAG: DUF1330 domain-containing protein [Alphaproteobacteria bacterium]
MPAFAIGWLRDLNRGADIAKYIQKIDATLPPFGGKFRIHGGAPEMLEGEWEGDLVAIEFPDREAARDWYNSPAYKEILGLRTENSRSVVFLIKGCDDDYLAASILEKITFA